MDKKLREYSNKNKDFFDLYGQCQMRILSFLYVMVHNENDAEDLLQDTAATMLEKYGTFQKGTNFTAWGITIAKNKALNFLRSSAKSRPRFSDDVYNRIVELEVKEGDTVSDRAIALDRCLKKLESADLEILKMRYYKELSMKKIAEILGRSKTGIYHTMARIHNLLAVCIKQTMRMEEV